MGACITARRGYGAQLGMEPEPPDRTHEPDESGGDRVHGFSNERKNPASFGLNFSKTGNGLRSLSNARNSFYRLPNTPKNSRPAGCRASFEPLDPHGSYLPRENDDSDLSFYPKLGDDEPSIHRPSPEQPLPPPQPGEEPRFAHAALAGLWAKRRSPPPGEIVGGRDRTPELDALAIDDRTPELDALHIKCLMRGECAPLEQLARTTSWDKHPPDDHEPRETRAGSAPPTIPTHRSQVQSLPSNRSQVQLTSTPEDEMELEESRHSSSGRHSESGRRADLDQCLYNFIKQDSPSLERLDYLPNSFLDSKLSHHAGPPPNYMNELRKDVLCTITEVADDRREGSLSSHLLSGQSRPERVASASLSSAAIARVLYPEQELPTPSPHSSHSLPEARSPRAPTIRTIRVALPFPLNSKNALNGFSPSIGNTVDSPSIGNTYYVHYGPVTPENSHSSTVESLLLASRGSTSDIPAASSIVKKMRTHRRTHSFT